MPNKAENVTAAKPKVAGAIFAAKKGTEIPKDAKTPLPDGFKTMGYVSKDGVKNSNSPANTDIEEWGGAVVLSTMTGRPDTFAFKLLETLNEDVLKQIYGESNVKVSGTDGEITVEVGADDMEEAVWVIEMILRGNRLKRIVIPSGKLTNLGDIVYNTADASGYDVTITCYPDEKGKSHYEYITKAEQKGNEEAVVNG